MNYPKIKNVKVINANSLLINFNNNVKKIYNINPLLKKDMFKPLKDPVLFNSVQIDIGGYALVWNENIDISEHELWKNGIEVDEN